MAHELEPHNATIVLAGAFDPTRYQPHWFAEHKLIRSSEAGEAVVEIIHPAAVIFRAKWFDAKVEEQKFQIGTEQEAMYDLLRDLAAGTFRHVASEGLQGIGLNRVFFFTPTSADSAHQLGDRLVPKEHWHGVVSDPGTLGVVIESRRDNDYKGNIQVKVQLANRESYRIMIDINDHYDLVGDDEKARPRIIRDILLEEWDNSMRRSLAIAEKIVSWGE